MAIHRTPHSRQEAPSRTATPPSPAEAAPGWTPGAERSALGRALANPGAISPADVLTLQRLVGNRAVTRLLAGSNERRSSTTPALQSKLVVGPTGDRYEQEADRAARQVLSGKPMPASITPLMASSGPAASGLDTAGEAEGAIARQRAGGSPLPGAVRARMEPLFGADFRGVRVHADSDAHALNHSIEARAFTTGRDIFFRQGEYNPASEEGQRLLAHELTHVVQQGGTLRSSPDAVSAVQRYPVKVSNGWIEKNNDKWHTTLEELVKENYTAYKASITDLHGLIRAVQANPESVTKNVKIAMVTLVWELPDPLFKRLMEDMETSGELKAFWSEVGTTKGGSEKIEALEVLVPVNVYLFPGAELSKIKSIFNEAAGILKQARTTPVIKNTFDVQPEVSEEYVGNTEGKWEFIGGRHTTSDTTSTDNRVKENDERLVKLITHFPRTKGVLNSFWFSKTSTYSSGYGMLSFLADPVNGLAIQGFNSSRLQGYDSVLISDSAAAQTFAHELGHILGGKTQGGHSDESWNLMTAGTMPGFKSKYTSLTPAQIAAFKASIYSTLVSKK